MSIRAGLFRLGRTLPRTSHRHPNPQTRLLPPSSRSVVFIRDNEVVHSKFQSYLDTLKKSSDQLNVIHQYYPALSWEVSQASSRNLSDSSSPSQEIDGTRIQDMLSREEFEATLESLAASGNAVDLQLIEDILSDMTNVFQVPPDSQTHSVIIRGLIQRKNLQTVHRWLQNMSKKPGNITPTLEHYHLLLEACPEFASIKFMRNLVQSMWKTGLLPDVETYKIFLRGAWTMTSGKPPAPAVIAPVMSDMRDAGIPYDADFLHFVQSLYFATGLTKYAHDIVVAYNTLYESALTSEKVLENRWIPQLSDPAQSLKIRLKAYHEYVKQGGSPSSNIFNALLRGCCTISQMEKIANTLDMDPTAQNWSSLIANSMKRGRVDDAFVAYREAVAAGIQPDASFVGPFLKEIFSLDKVPPKALADRGLSIYSNFCSNASAETSSLDLEIHQMMLGALTKLPKIEEYSDITETILKELKARNVPMHDIAASIIVTDMNGASDPAEALEAYKAYRIALDGQGYEKVLEAFCRFYLQQNFKVPPLTTYFSIVKDMKAAGFPATSSIYTILLRLLGQAGTLARRRAEYHMIADKCIAATKRVHDLITLESSIVPDAILWNQLLDTYSRLDCNADVLRLWDQMYMSRQFDNVSVSVVFDTCRRIRSLQRIQQTYEQLKREKFKLTLNNWNSYIEALCSVGDLNTALKALCLEMSLNDVKPEVYTANLILHQEALKQTQLRTEMFKRIKRHQPELYNELVRSKTEDRKDLES